MQKNYLDGQAITLLTLLCLLFGWQQIAIKFTLDGISPLMQAGLRSVGATLLVGLWMKIQGETLLRRDGVELWGLLAGLLFAGEFLLLYWALELTSASRATVFLYTSPFIVALGAQWLIPGERLTRIQVIGLLCAFTGVIIAFNDAFSSKAALIGDLMALAAAICWGATTVLVKATSLHKESASRMLIYQLAVSAVLLPLGSLLIGEPGIIKLDQQTLLAMLFQTLMVATVGYLSWFWLMRHYPASRIATFSFLTPLFAVISAWLILDEQLTVHLIAALLFVAVGIYLVNIPKPNTLDTTDKESNKKRPA